MSARKDMEALVRAYRRLGWQVTKTKRGGHWRLHHPDVDGCVIASSTPGDPVAIRKVRAQLERLTPRQKEVSQ